MYSVILCGGSGTRLWPLSRKNFPKQFLKLYSKHSLLQETFLRIRKLSPQKKIFFVTNKENSFHVLNHIRELENNFPENHILIEPKSLNTAPAIALAIKYLIEKFKVNLNDPIFFLPSDHHIKNEKKFLNLIKLAKKETGNNIGTIGLTPLKPETGFGYIEKGEKNNHFFKVIDFKEKPNKKLAKKYVDSGKYVWNAGIYFFNAKTFLEEIKKHAPLINKILKYNLNNFIKNFSKMPNISIDFALSEKSKKVIVFEGEFGWSDIGSFDGLSDLIKNKNNNRHININSKNVFVHSESDHLIATIGLDDIIIVENKDSILIKKRGQSSEVKKIVKHLKEKNIKELNHLSSSLKDWGNFEILKQEKKYKIKKITIYPNKKIKFKTTKNKIKILTALDGSVNIFYKYKKIKLNKNENILIPANTNYYLENTEKLEIKIIELENEK